MDKKFHLTRYQACNYLSILGLKLNHVSKRGPCTVCKLHLYKEYRASCLGHKQDLVCLNIKMLSFQNTNQPTRIGIRIIKIRRSHDHLIFIMGIMCEKTVFILIQGQDKPTHGYPQNTHHGYKLSTNPRVLNGGCFRETACQVTFH